MENAELWWIDQYKHLHKYALTDTLPPQIHSTGKLYLVVAVPDHFGLFNIYNLSTLPNIDVSSLTSTDGLGQPLQFMTGDNTYAHTYDVMRRSEWVVTHTNIQTGQSNNQQMETIDPDLVIAQNEITDLTNSLVFVNGAYHQSVIDPNSNALCVYDGCQTLRNEKTHDDVTLLDFTPVGGCKLYPLTSAMLVGQEALPKSVKLDISQATGYGKETLRDYTVQLIIDGSLYSAGMATQSISDTIIEITIGKLDLLRNYLRSPLMRKSPIPFPITDDIRPKSDAHDKAWDVFDDNTVIANTSLMTNDWILERMTSRHSAIVLIPKTVTTVTTDLFNETNEPWWKILPSKATKINSLLTMDAKRYSPLYLHTQGYRNRTLMPMPYHEGRTMQSLDDPLGTVTADPSRDIQDIHRIDSAVRLTQWYNIPVLGEFK